MYIKINSSFIHDEDEKEVRYVIYGDRNLLDADIIHKSYTSDIPININHLQLSDVKFVMVREEEGKDYYGIPHCMNGYDIYELYPQELICVMMLDINCNSINNDIIDKVKKEYDVVVINDAYTSWCYNDRYDLLKVLIINVIADLYQHTCVFMVAKSSDYDKFSDMGFKKIDELDGDKFLLVYTKNKVDKYLLNSLLSENYNNKDNK